MSWLFSMSQQAQRPQRAFYERVWQRKSLVAFDAVWPTLSVPARKRYVEELRGPQKADARPVFFPASKFSAPLIEEWSKAGLVEIDKSGSKEKIFVPPAARGFSARVHALKRYELLSDESSSQLPEYAVHACEKYELAQVMHKIVAQSFDGEEFDHVDPLETFVYCSGWPNWVCAYLKDPLGAEILKVLDAEDGWLPLNLLPSRLPNANPDALRASVDQLVNHLALVEDLDDAFNIIVGYARPVQQSRNKKKEATTPPVPVTPKHIGPVEGEASSDLRAVLLELTVEPARVKQNGEPYRKDEERLEGAMPPLPSWYNPEHSGISVRLRNALRYARDCSFTEIVGEEEKLQVSKQGQHWLASNLPEQVAKLCNFYRTPPESVYRGSWDTFYLGSGIVVVPSDKGHAGHVRYRRDLDYAPLRRELQKWFLQLPLDEFFRLEEVVTRMIANGNNPLYLGRDRKSVRIYDAGDACIPLEDVETKLAGRLLRELILTRLAPLGAIQLGLDAEGKLLVARRALLGVYFGEKPKENMAPPTARVTRVLVQPDFTVMLIGLNPAAAADLLAFAERHSGHASAESMTLKLTKESVIRGIGAGLTQETIVARLVKHATIPPPANVLTQVKSWCGVTRVVTTELKQLIRCPDEETAQRVLAAVGRKGERIAPTIVGLAHGELNTAMKKKLKDQGLLFGK